jgi:hypothetical protein
MLCMWQHGAWGAGDELVWSRITYNDLPCPPMMTGQSNAAQVNQARTEARAEAVAAAEECCAAALEHQRAELVKQARSWLCTCGNRDVRCTALACFCALCVQSCVEPLCMPRAWQRGTEDGDELQCLEAPVLLMTPC